MERRKIGANSILGECQNWVVLIIAAIAVTPSFLLTSLYFTAFRAAVRVGHWPYHGNPDASAMPEELQPGSGPLALFLPLVVYGASVAFLTGWVLRCSERSWRIPVSLVAGAFIWVLLVGFFYFDPAGVWQWIMD